MKKNVRWIYYIVVYIYEVIRINYFVFNCCCCFDFITLSLFPGLCCGEIGFANIYECEITTMKLFGGFLLLLLLSVCLSLLKIKLELFYFMLVFCVQIYLFFILGCGRERERERNDTKLKVKENVCHASIWKSISMIAEIFVDF